MTRGPAFTARRFGQWFVLLASTFEKTPFIIDGTRLFMRPRLEEHEVTLGPAGRANPRQQLRVDAVPGLGYSIPTHV